MIGTLDVAEQRKSFGGPRAGINKCVSSALVGAGERGEAIVCCAGDSGIILLTIGD